MSNKLTPVYMLPINSECEIQYALNYSEREKQRITDHLNAQRYHFSIEETKNNLDLGLFFKQAYDESKAFTPAAKEALQDYQEVLVDSLSICRDITPLLVSSFQCHHEALRYYSVEQQESAMAAIAQTGKTAKKIASLCERLKGLFNIYSAKLQETMISISRLKSDREQEFKEGRSDCALAKEIDLLDSAFRSLANARTATLNVGCFWQNAALHSKSLATPDLADPIMIEVMLSPEEVETTRLENAAKLLDAALSARAQYIQNFKDGRVNVIRCGLYETPYYSEFHQSIKLSLPQQGIKKNFENTYFNWLALARLNIDMNFAIKEGLERVKLWSELCE